ncbi:hypothetical protein Unana1_05079 [Umbelopsis nana]
MSFLTRLVRQNPSVENKSDLFAYANKSGNEPATITVTIPHQRPDRLRESPELYRLQTQRSFNFDKVSFRNSIVKRSDSGYQSICEEKQDDMSEDLQYIDETYYPSLQLWDQQDLEAAFSHLDLDNMTEQQEIEEYLSKFDCSKVYFQDTKTEISRYGAIQRIEATDKSIVRLSPNIALLWPALTHLCLANNLLDKLPSSLACLRNLTTLDLSNNKLTELPKNLGRLTRLSHLNLSHNKIMHLPESIGSLRKLAVLYLNDNQLSYLPKSLGDLKLLTTLDICRNLVKVIPAEVSRLQLLRYIRTEGCPLMLEYVPELKHDPPSLLELAARTIVRNELQIPDELREDMKEYIGSAKKCTHCSGPYISSCVRRIKLIEKADQNVIPLEYTLCSAHWSNERERTIAMFSSRPSTSKRPAHILRAEKALRLVTGSPTYSDLLSPRQQSQTVRQQAPSSTRRTIVLGQHSNTPSPNSSQSTDIFSVPDREGSPVSMLSSSASISIGYLARKMYTSTPNSMAQMETVLSTSSSGSSTPEIVPATLPTRWRAQKVRNRSNTGFLSLSKLQRAASLTNIPSAQGFAI